MEGWVLWPGNTSVRLQPLAQVVSNVLYLFCFWVFSYQSFISQTLTTQKTAGERREPYFISLYRFHLLTNIHTYILQLSKWDDYHRFLIAPLVFTRLLLDVIYHLIRLLFNWFMMWFWLLFVYLLIWFQYFLTAIWHWKAVSLTIILVLQANQLSVLVTLSILLL